MVPTEAALIEDARSTTSTVVASLFGITSRYVSELSKMGVLPHTSTGNRRLYNLYEVIPAYIEFKVSQVSGGDDLDELKKQKMQMEIQYKKSQTELHELKTDIQKGKYKTVDDIKRDYETFFTVFKKMALSIPQRVSGLIASRFDPQEARRVEKDLDVMIKNTLTNFVLNAISEED